MQLTFMIFHEMLFFGFVQSVCRLIGWRYDSEMAKTGTKCYFLLSCLVLSFTQCESTRIGILYRHFVELCKIILMDNFPAIWFLKIERHLRKFDLNIYLHR